jgi:hypothetical protein
LEVERLSWCFGYRPFSLCFFNQNVYENVFAFVLGGGEEFCSGGQFSNS